MTRPGRTMVSIWTLLDEQRQALLSGDLAVLDRLPDRLERAMRDLADERPSPEALTQLAHAAAHNARLILAARDGLARARRDIAPATPLTTYDGQGRRQLPDPTGQLLARR